MSETNKPRRSWWWLLLTVVLVPIGRAVFKSLKKPKAKSDQVIDVEAQEVKNLQD
jgi:uncharacterized protein involved in exopolysaccharide biosynthesis